MFSLRYMIGIKKMLKNYFLSIDIVRRVNNMPIPQNFVVSSVTGQDEECSCHEI